MALEDGREAEIFHPVQGCQFTSGDFVARLQAEKIRISWSGRKRCSDNFLGLAEFHSVAPDRPVVLTA
jgi:putative transposase